MFACATYMSASPMTLPIMLAILTVLFVLAALPSTSALTLRDATTTVTSARVMRRADATARASLRKQFTFDSCRSEQECAPSLLCLTVVSLLLGPCDRQSDEECKCLPFPAFTDCTKSSQCLIGEDCAISPNTGRTLCASCRVIADGTFAPVNPASTWCSTSPKSPTPPHPPTTNEPPTLSSPPDQPDEPNEPEELDEHDQSAPPEQPLEQPEPPKSPALRARDLCSVNARCAEGLDCFNVHGRACSRNDVLCKCRYLRNDARVAICATSVTCARRERCAWHVTTGLRRCVSCLAALANPKLVLVDTDAATVARCSGISAQSVSLLAASPNGLVRDTCVNDLTCRAELRCVLDARNSTIACPVTGSPRRVPCRCAPRIPVPPCKRSSSCTQSGEVCARLSRSTQRECVSANYLSTLRPRMFKLYGTKKVPLPAVGEGLTGAQCRFDWDCTGLRRCTHIDDRFGGCAGRRICRCQPYLRQPCGPEADVQSCASGEACFEYEGARSKPFCLSVRAHTKVRFPYLKRVDGAAPTYPKVQANGVTGEFCKSDSDCDATLRCRHFTESFGYCNGRKACVCKTRKVGVDARQCRKNADCLIDEVCTQAKDSLSRRKRCLSKNLYKESDIVSKS